MLGKIVKGNLLREFKGYTNKSASEKKILRNVFKTGDAWFRSGDLMMRDEEGFIFFKDRVGDTFRWKGENVATSEVAEVLAQWHEVTECNVYGVMVPETDGRCGMALVTTAVKDIDFKGLFAHLLALPTYARPVFLRVSPGGQ